MSRRYPLLSKSWLSGFQEAAQRAVDNAGPVARGVQFAIAEVFRNAPATVPFAANREVGFTLRFANGRAEVQLGVDRSEQLDLLKEGEWGDALISARMHAGPDRDAFLAGTFGAGRASLKGDPSKVPTFLSTLHNEVADITE